MKDRKDKVVFTGSESGRRALGEHRDMCIARFLDSVPAGQGKSTAEYLLSRAVS